ncbi:hypothetical protein BKA64DRAFT_278804 [Cadophora sp. MPI-SDFR-AT-0126]|nr:hypothetical protein BKA64DRAFT_278804 [Leotiomycetes sp. MPI-SDFR-AT-0126]
MAQQAGTPAIQWACNVHGCNITCSRLADVRRHEAEFHGSGLFQCHVPGCRWQGAKRKDRLTNHMKTKHAELIGFVLDLPDIAPLSASPSGAHHDSHDQGFNVGYDYNTQQQQSTSINASGSSTYAAQASYLPGSSSAPASSQADTNQYSVSQQLHPSSSQHYPNGGDIGQYYSHPTNNQYSSSNPAGMSTSNYYQLATSNTEYSMLDGGEGGVVEDGNSEDNTVYLHE